MYDVLEGISSSSVSVHPETVTGLLSEMLDYPEGHLKYEEQLLRDNIYSDFENHVLHHQFYLEKISSISMATMDYENNTPTEILIF